LGGRPTGQDAGFWSRDSGFKSSPPNRVPSYSVNPAAVAHAEKLIRARQYVLDSDWGDVQPKAAPQSGQTLSLGPPILTGTG
jgi:hypothetical protein